jgi:hypothetical protein
MCCVCGRLSELSEFLSLAIPMLKCVPLGASGQIIASVWLALPADGDIDRFDTVAIYSADLHAVFGRAKLDTF